MKQQTIENQEINNSKHVYLKGADGDKDKKKKKEEEKEIKVEELEVAVESWNLDKE